MSTTSGAWRSFTTLNRRWYLRPPSLAEGGPLDCADRTPPSTEWYTGPGPLPSAHECRRSDPEACGRGAECDPADRAGACAPRPQARAAGAISWWTAGPADIAGGGGALEARATRGEAAHSTGRGDLNRAVPVVDLELTCRAASDAAPR